MEHKWYRHESRLIYSAEWNGRCVEITDAFGGKDTAALNDFFAEYKQFVVIPAGVGNKLYERHERNKNMFDVYQVAAQRAMVNLAQAEDWRWIVLHPQTFARAWLDGYQVAETGEVVAWEWFDQSEEDGQDE